MRDENLMMQLKLNKGRYSYFLLILVKLNGKRSKRLLISYATEGLKGISFKCIYPVHHLIFPKISQLKTPLR